MSKTRGKQRAESLNFEGRQTVLTLIKNKKLSIYYMNFMADNTEAVLADAVVAAHRKDDHRRHAA